MKGKQMWLIGGGITSTLLIIAFIMLLLPKGEREECVPYRSVFEKADTGYELIDMAGREVWATTDFTIDEFQSFSMPASWSFWRKNDPRSGQATRGQFLRSPGCAEDRYTYLHAFGKSFQKVVELKQLPGKLDSEGLLHGVRLEKYHVIQFEQGTSVKILHSPQDERYILVARTSPESDQESTLPPDWRISVHRLEADLTVNLTGDVTVIRTDTEDSYQGPLPASLQL